MNGDEHMKFDAEVKREIIKIAAGCAVCTAITMVVYLAVGRFDYTVAVGGALGLAVSLGNFVLMCIGVIRALETGNEAYAKLKLRSSYIARTLVQAGVIAYAFSTGAICPIPVAVAVFYPRLTIAVCDLIHRIARRDASLRVDKTAVSAVAMNGEKDGE